MRFHLPRRKIWRFSIYLVSLLLVLLAADLILVQVRRSFTYGYDTTRIVGPVLPDGRIDYLSILDGQRGQGVTPVNNAAVPFMQAVGRSALPQTQPPDGITDKLGMPHLPEQGDYLVRFDDFAKQQDITGMGDTQPELPTNWPPTFTPLTEQWVKANAHPLELLVEASTRSRFFIPFDGGNRPEVLESVLLTHIRGFRDGARLLLTRSMIRLNSDDFAGFREDLLATHRLARLLGQSSTGVELAESRTSLEDPACEIGRVAAASGKLSAQQARTLSTDLAELPELPPMSNCIDGERFLILDVLQTLATVPPDRGAEMFNGMMGTSSIATNIYFRLAPLPYEAAMRQMNHCYDGAIAAMRLADYPHRIAAMNLWEEENAKTRSGSYVFDLFTPSFAVRDLLLSIVRMENRQETSLAEFRLTQIALALCAYKADHSRYPQSLDELSPSYLPSIPNDPFTEQPMPYALTTTGYTLHSAGPHSAIAANVP